MRLRRFLVTPLLLKRPPEQQQRVLPHGVALHLDAALGLGTPQLGRVAVRTRRQQPRSRLLRHLLDELAQETSGSGVVSGLEELLRTLPALRSGVP